MKISPNLPSGGINDQENGAAGDRGGRVREMEEKK